jgi:hypothetical protein
MGALIWLASYPKSGNTWIRAFLHNYLYRAVEPFDINRLSDFTTGESGAALYRRYDPRPASTYSVEDVQRMRPLVHRDLTQAWQGPVFVKTHNAVLLAAGVPLLTPSVTSGAVYSIRDPRDVAVSYSRHAGKPIDWVIDFMANEQAAAGGDDEKVFEKLGSWSLHVRSWTERPNPKLLVLRYETLLADPAAEFARLVRFLGLPPEPARLDTAIGHSDFAVLQAQEQQHGFVERPAGSAAFFNTGKAGGWRQILTPAEAARIERDHGAEMRRFGYL